MEQLSLSIDGKIVDCPAGTSLLKAAERHGIKIPRLCDHPDLTPCGSCRICLVEDEKTGRLMASCVTPAAQDMVIRTASDRIKKHRRNIIRLMIAEHPESCIVCNKGNRCRLRQIAAEMGLGETNLYNMPNSKRLEQVNPFIIRDLSKCILCAKCIRADHELVVVGAIDYSNRGFSSRPTTVHDLPLEDSSCTFCGTCVSVCPTGALIPNHPLGAILYAGTPEREAFSICGFCGVGCALSMGVAGERIVEINPSHHPETVNRSTLCVRGHFTHDFLNNPNRLTRPMVLKDGQLAPVAWDEALDVITRRLLEIKKENGPQSVAFLGSSKCTNEENYLFQKIARVFMKTNNVDNAGYLSGQALYKRFGEKTDGGCRVNPLADLETAEIILVIGAEPNQSVPVVGYSLKRAAKKAIPLVVIDPRRTELVSFSTIWLRIKPQTDAELINGLTKLLYEKKGHDQAFIDQYTKGFDALRKSFKSLDLNRVCSRTDLKMNALDEAAEWLKAKKVAIVVGSGILQQRNGIRSLEALINLSLMTGSLGLAGAGIYILAKENNQIGAMDMGAVPDLLPGGQSITDDAARNKWEQAWNFKLSPDPGLNLVQMIESAEKGDLKALYIMGENPLRAFPQPQRVKKALQKLKFLVVQDILKGETADIADVVLPGAAFCEKAGSFTNLEGRIQSFSAAVPPPSDAKPDWEILDRLAAKMGSSEPYGDLEKIRSETRRLVPMYATLEENKQGWVIASSRKAAFHGRDASERIAFCPATASGDEPFDESYPFTAILGSLRYHLGSGTRTAASKRIQQLHLDANIQMSPIDAAKINIKNGDPVNITSPYGTVRRVVSLEKNITGGQLFIPLATGSNDAMSLVALHDVSKPDFPGIKTVNVRIAKA